MLSTSAFMVWLNHDKPSLIRSPTQPTVSALTAPAAIPDGFERSCLGDVHIELFAYTLNVPGQRSDVWRNPATHEELTIRQLVDAGATRGYLKAPNCDHAPVLALILKTRGIQNLQNTSSSVQDARTSVQIDQGVGYSVVHPLALGQLRSRLIEVNTELGIWHDTPIQINLGFGYTNGSATNSEQLWFKLDGLPDMPNDREIENLFDVKITALTTSNPIEVVLRATQLQRHEIRVDSRPTPIAVAGSGRIILSGSGGTVSRSSVSGKARSSGPSSAAISSGIGTINIKSLRRTSTGPVIVSGGVLLGNIAPVETYENLTVSELLQRYTESHSGDPPTFEIDPTTLTLIEKYGERSFAQKAQDWWNNQAPEWIQIP